MSPHQILKCRKKEDSFALRGSRCEKGRERDRERQKERARERESERQRENKQSKTERLSVIDR